jgi:hypothetical protein
MAIPGPEQKERESIDQFGFSVLNGSRGLFENAMRNAISNAMYRIAHG